ncbi:hypothetical protein [Sporolactobacillus putidus]|uniref:Uncharacterized protein n=1 Tax=Sporolactobacillus putidus TaxID=492735 RepID=A0A917S621_9BACL|nr:hypothetical protein [Sporolactobacillus putidus]GGL55957.1 hypothetical protein GCM10007968_20080 [Sporolactobacillus putidus]
MTQRKKATLASFGNVANEDNNENINEEVNVDNNENDSNSIVKSMVSDRPQKKNEKKLTGIYFDPDVSVALDRLKASGKLNVSKSVFVNNVVKAALKENGLM